MNARLYTACLKDSVLLLAIVLALLWSAISEARIVWDARKLLESRVVADLGKPIELRDGKNTGLVRVDYLRTLVEAHERLGNVSKVNALLVIAVDKDMQAMADHVNGLIIFTTGMLNLVGSDPNMAAAVMAHEFAHFSRKHAFQTLLAMPKILRGATQVANSALVQTGDRQLSSRVGELAVDLLAASHSREQEAEADKVGAEFMSAAKYDPAGTLRVFNAMIKIGGPRKTAYLSTHPGLEDRLALAAPTVLNQRYDTVAEGMVESRNWKQLGLLVSQWLAKDPDNARAWYYRAIYLRERREPGALQAFAWAVRRDPSYMKGRLELCVELYRSGREMESLVCSEFLPLNEERDQFVARTFRHVVLVGGMNKSDQISDEDARILSAILGRPDLAPRTGPRLPR